MSINRRIKLGIVFKFNPSWMGGIIYILNLVKIFDFLSEDEKPEITIFYKPDLKEFIDTIKYPYLNTVEWEFPNVYKGYLKSFLSRKNLFVKNLIDQYELDGLYPVHDYPVKTKSETKLVCWFADLQHKYYPEFFTTRKRFERDLRHLFMFRNSKDLVVSSEAVKKDFMKFYKIPDHLKIHVFHFASVIEDFSHLNINEIRSKYDLPEEYFLISNQFHKHKNHRVLLKSLIRLNNVGKRIHLAMTGRFPDASYSEYMQELHSIIRENQLESQISLMGILPREEQLLLMKYAQAVIQPSLFEGWSTVIEDSISLQVPVIASSLPVNIEQLGSDGYYFDPHDDQRLAEIITNFPTRNLSDKFYEDYTKRVTNAAETFLRIFKNKVDYQNGI